MKPQEAPSVAYSGSITLSGPDEASVWSHCHSKGGLATALRKVAHRYEEEMTAGPAEGFGKTVVPDLRARLLNRTVDSKIPARAESEFKPSDELNGVALESKAAR